MPCELIGYSEAELQQLAEPMVFQSGDSRAEADLHESMLRGERRSYGWEARIVRRDSSVRWVRVHFPRRLARLTGVVAGLILIGLAVLHLPSVRSGVLDRARAYVQREFGVTLKASSLSYNLFRRSVELRDLSLASAEHPFLEADRALVVFGPGIFLVSPDAGAQPGMRVK